MAAEGTGGVRATRAASLAGVLVRRFIEEHGLLAPGQPVLAAFSGGADSTALASVLDELGYQVTLCHVDHGMRPGSHRDAQRAEGLAGALGLPIVTREVSVEDGSEAGAREARYQALEAVADGLGISTIATGHTLDDEAETVLMRLMRGGFGLGIPLKRGRVVRPLLCLRRQDTERLCRGVGIEPIEDPSNQDDSWLRNFIRRRVLAEAPEWVFSALIRLGERNRRRRRSTSAKVEDLLSRVRERHGATEVPRAVLQGLSGQVRQQLLRVIAEKVVGTEVTGDTVRQLAKSWERTGAEVSLPGGKQVWVEADQVVFGPQPVSSKASPSILPIPGETTWGPWTARASFAEGLGPTSETTAFFDARSLGQRVTIRSRRPGDRIAPLGLGGTRKVQDVMVDAKVPARRRDEVPLAETSSGDIAWVVGGPVSEHTKVTDATEQVVRIDLIGPASAG